MTIPVRNAISARSFPWIAATCIATTMLGAPACAQQERMGVSHPDAEVITADSDTPPPAETKAAKPSAAIPATPSTEVYGPYVPYRAPGTPVPAAAVQTAFDPDANIVTAATAGESQRRLLNTATDPRDPDAGIVTRVPLRPGEIPYGTLVKAKLGEDLSTVTTAAGSKFTARVSEPVTREGQVIIPAGSLLEGRVTWVRGGKRIGGAAAIHLEPRTIMLPDGGQYIVRARVIDTDNWNNTKVDSEGTILRKENGKQTLAVMSLAAGGPMAAGAVLGGIPGALVGAGVGAGVGTAIWLKQDRQAELPKDLVVVFSLTEPMSITPIAAGNPAAVTATPPAGD